MTYLYANGGWIETKPVIYLMFIGYLQEGQLGVVFEDLSR